MVWIIVPVRRVKRIVYYCPRCGRKERFYFSLLPLLKPVWPCRGCRTKIKVPPVGFAYNWAGVFALYSLPLTLLLGELLIVTAAFQQKAKSPTPNLLGTLMGAVFCGGPALMLLGAFCFAVLGYIVGGIYGMFAVKR